MGFNRSLSILIFKVILILLNALEIVCIYHVHFMHLSTEWIVSKLFNYYSCKKSSKTQYSKNESNKSQVQTDNKYVSDRWIPRYSIYIKLVALIFSTSLLIQKQYCSRLLLNIVLIFIFQFSSYIIIYMKLIFRFYMEKSPYYTEILRVSATITSLAKYLTS